MSHITRTLFQTLKEQNCPYYLYIFLFIPSQHGAVKLTIVSIFSSEKLNPRCTWPTHFITEPPAAY